MERVLPFFDISRYYKTFRIISYFPFSSFQCIIACKLFYKVYNLIMNILFGGFTSLITIKHVKMLVDFIFNIPNNILANIVCKSKASKKIKKKTHKNYI